jgi:hypothetical protein
MEDESDALFYFLVLPPESYTSLFWPFDGSINEVNDRMVATSDGTISFVSPGVYGRESAIYFNGSQYLNMSSTKFKLSSNSFSFEMWLYLMSVGNGVSPNAGILGQCQSMATDACLHLEIRGSQSFLGFYGDDCPGQTSLTSNIWYHLAFVYDATITKQFIYLNGNLECSRTANNLAIMNTTPLTIGIDLFAQNGKFYYFYGYIDQLSYLSTAKTGNEILDDATLIVYFSFNQNSLLDSSSNQMNGTAYQLTLIDNALLFNQTSSAFQIETFDSSSISDSSSIAFWINPSSTNNGIIVHIFFSNSTNSSLCWNMIRFDNQGYLISQIQTNGIISITGSVINPNVWTYIVQTYSPINGFKLYINGTFINGTGAINYMNTKQTQTVTLGACLQNCQSCGIGSIIDSHYVGLMDEFRMYSRELNLSDIQSLI